MCRKYQYLVSAEGRNKAEVLQENETAGSKFIVHDESDRSYLVFDSYDDFKKWFSQTDIRTLHEVIIKGAPQKLRFDIDADNAKIANIPKLDPPQKPAEPELVGWDEMDQLLLQDYHKELEEYHRQLEEYNARNELELKRLNLREQVVASIRKVFEQFYGYSDIDLIITDSSNDNKFSCHIIINGFFVTNNNDAKLFAIHVIDDLAALNINNTIIDDGIYKTNQMFRLPDCHKKGEPTRPKRIITHHDFDDALITRHSADAQELPSFAVPIQPKDALKIECDDAQVLQLAEPYINGHTFKSKTSNLYLFKRVAASECPICRKIHDCDNTLMISVSQYGNVKLHCRLSRRFLGQKVSIDIGQVLAEPVRPEPAERFAFDVARIAKYPIKADEIPDGFSRVEYCANEVAEFDFNGADSLIIKSPMGTGKTKRLCEFIEKVPENVRIIIVSFRRSFTSELCAKLAGFTDYRKAKTRLNQMRLVVQFESLHRLDPRHNVKTVLILDESESILTQVENRKSGENTSAQCWHNFQHLVTYSEAVIAMDAFAGHRTYSLMALARQKVCIHINSWKPPVEDAPIDKYYGKEDDWDAAITDATLAREPIVIVSNTLKKAKFIERRCRQLAPEAKIKMYCSETDAAERADLENVNAAWADVDILIYTSTISAGCSFEGVRFSKLFAYFSSKSTDYITSIQMMGRVRNLASKEYHIFIREYPVDIPQTKAELEQVLRQCNGVTLLGAADVQVALQNAPRFVNRLGELDFAFKDLFYHVHVNNLLHRCQSIAKFYKRFVSLRINAGVRVENANIRELDPEIISQMREIKKNIDEQVKREDRQKLLDARGLTDEEAEVIKRREENSREDAAALTMHNLAADYGVPREAINEDFLKTYNKPRVRRAWHNLRRINILRQDPTLVKNAEAMIKGLSVDQRFVEENNSRAELANLRRNGEAVGVLLCMDIINILFDEVGREVNRFIKRYICRPLLEIRIKQVIEYLRPKIRLISYLFDIKKGRIAEVEKQTFKQQLEFVNVILFGTFDMKIIRGKNDRDMFYLLPCGKFVYDAANNQWKVQPQRMGNIVINNINMDAAPAAEEEPENLVEAELEL